MRGHGESKPHVHSAGIMLHRSIEKFFYFSKADNFFKFAINLRSSHPEDRAIKIDIFPPAQFAVETGTDFKETCHSAADLDTSRGRLRYAAQYFQQGALARSIAANETYDLAFADFK